ncbi:hypothetical protein MSPP1_002006 [Malassezia sp. CBS 17886]|nr:hypothetical protein MSPP1_002006 [Malassezia sp. CBS 17886]
MEATQLRGGDGAKRRPFTRRAPPPTEEARRAAKTTAAAAAAAAKKERKEWDRTRGAGSSVLLWFEEERRRNPSALESFCWEAVDVVAPRAEVLARAYESCDVMSMDRLLDWGICDYTVLPRTLGCGRFSTVYLAVKHGARYAIKHTPLWPHHELVATRLMREPTLLAELPPHPNLVGVVETIRTPGHFYLVEEFLDGYVTLEALLPLVSAAQPPVLPVAVAERLFEQLVLVLHAIHWPLRVCHRDVKPENILVHPQTLHLKLLDFGLATHFSKSRAKLTTCCGSPAFHCPEIVTALAQPPGSAAYWGPEVDAWTCAITMLRCLSGVRYPLGTSHTSPAAMAVRAKRVVQALPAHPLRDQLARLLDVDGRRRMRSFAELADTFQQRTSAPAGQARRELKSTSFLPSVPLHSISLPLVHPAPTDAGPAPPPAHVVPPTYAVLELRNPTRQPVLRVLSFLKYCLRCAGILYHTLPYGDAAPCVPSADSAAPPAPFLAPPKDVYIFQCVVELASDEPVGLFTSLVHSVRSLFGQRADESDQSFVPRLTGQPDTPARDALGKDTPVKPSSGPSGHLGPVRALVFTLAVWFSSADDERAAGAVDAHPETDAGTPSAAHASVEHGVIPNTRPAPLPAAAPPAAEPHTYSPQHAHPPPRSGRHPSHAHIKVGVSDPRALRYVRGALDRGGVHTERARAPEADGAAALRSQPASPARPAADAAAPGVDAVHVRPLRAEELGASLGAIEGACRTLLRLRTSDDTGSGEETRAYACHVYGLLHHLYTRLDACVALHEHQDAMHELLAEFNFRALDVLSPALALVSDTDRKSAGATETTGSLALASLQAIARCSSAKEMCLGCQEQIERLCGASRGAALRTAQPDADQETLLVRDGAMAVQAILGILQLLATVLPGVRARRPHAVVAPILALLRRLYTDMIRDTLQCMAPGDACEELATQAVVLLCETAVASRAVLLHNVPEHGRAHAADSDALRDKDAADALRDTNAVLVDGLAGLLPFLPDTRGMSQVRLLSQCEYDALFPEHAEPGAPATAADTQVSPRISVWNLVRKTYKQLHVDLGRLSFGPPHRAGATARNTFLLLVHQLAYEALMAQVKDHQRERVPFATPQGTHLGNPRAWRADTARDLLAHLAPRLPDVLFPHLPALDAPPPPSAVASAQDAALTDALVTFAVWAVAALAREPTHRVLSDGSVTHVVRALAFVASQSPDARIRQTSFALTVDLVRDCADDDVVVHVVREMLAPTAPPALRASAVYLVRDVYRAHIERLSAAGARDAAGDPLLVHGRVWTAWRDALFDIPENLPSASCAEEALAEYMELHTPYLLECCALYYFLRVRDAAHDYTGLADAALDERLQSRFFRPLRAFVDHWLARAQTPPPPQSADTPAGLVSTRLGLLSLALERAAREQER